MSYKARRRPTWKVKHRRFPSKYQTARYTLPYIKYWHISFYEYWETRAESEHHYFSVVNGTIKKLENSDV